MVIAQARLAASDVCDDIALPGYCDEYRSSYGWAILRGGFQQPRADVRGLDHNVLCMLDGGPAVSKLSNTRPGEDYSGYKDDNVKLSGTGNTATDGVAHGCS